MKLTTVTVFTLLILFGTAQMHSIHAQNPLNPLSFLVGGVWVGEYDLPNGETLRQERTYEWSLDKQLIIGKTFRITDDSRRQTRKTIFSWNAEKKIIEFWDFIDTGGYGKGIVKETGKDTLHMKAKIIGSNHIDWQADFINKEDKEFVSNVQVPQNGEWEDAGTFVFRKKTDNKNKQRYIYVLKLKDPFIDRDNWTEKENNISAIHFEHLKTLTKQGTVILSGRTLNTDKTQFGIVIFEANSKEEAMQIMKSDPAIEHGLMTAELFPYRIATGK